MKKILSILFIYLLSFQSLSHAQEPNLQIKTNYDAPFHKLTLDSSWELYDLDKNFICFNQKKDDDITLAIREGKDLKKEVSIEKLYKQITKAKGQVKDISLLTSSFLEFYYATDILGEEIELKDYTYVSIHGLKGIKAYRKESFPIVEAIRGNSALDLEIPNWTLCYFFELNNRLYFVIFEAPSTKFAEYESFFEQTLIDLF